MHRRVVLSFAILLTMAAVAMAAPAITVGPHPLPNVTPTQTDTIDVNYDTALSGGGTISGQTIYISIVDEGNGGGGSADAGEPKIVSVDGVTGTVWSGNNTGFTYVVINDQVGQYDITVSGANVSAAGKLFSIVIDRNGASNNTTWGLRVFVSVPGLGGPYSSNWSLTGGAIGSPFDSSDPFTGPFVVSDPPGSAVRSGSFTYAPEPSSIVLGLFAAAGLGVVAIRRRRARA